MTMSPRFGAAATLVALLLAPWNGVAQAAEDAAESEFSDLSLEALLALPVVQTVSLRDQGLLEAPASVTVIREEQIRSSGATTLAELLRLVPGMHVMQLTGNTYSIGLRGISRLINDRVLILVDGHPYRDYQNGEARLGSIYVNPLDVVKIEVIRGPGSVIYGAGALSGVVNIITKSSGRHGVVEASSWGALGVVRNEAYSKRPLMENSGGARVVLNLKNASNSLGARVGFSMNHFPEWPNQASPDVDSQASASILGSHGYSLFASGRYRGVGNLQMNADAFHTSTEDVGISDISNVPVTNRITTQQLAYRIERPQILELLDVSLALRGRRLTLESPASTVQPVDSRSYKLDALLQLTLSLFDKRNVTTAASEAGFAESSGYFCSPSTWSNGLILSNDTYLAKRRLVLSLAGRFDRISSKDDTFGQVIHRVFSYRGALTYRFVEHQAVRISASSSFRTPTPYESFASVPPAESLVAPTPGAPPLRFVVGNPLLVPEQVLNFEAGYRARMLGMLQTDLAVFGQQVENLIANDPANGIPAFKINRFNHQQIGFELGLRAYPSVTTSAYLNYSFVYSRDSDTKARIKEFPTHIGGLGAEVRLPWHSRVSVDTYYVFDYHPDVTHLTDGSALPALENQSRRAADQVLVNLRAGHMIHKDSVELFVMGKNLVGLFREPSGLRMYPIQSAQPIGATLLAGIIVNSN